MPRYAIKLMWSNPAGFEMATDELIQRIESPFEEVAAARPPADGNRRIDELANHEFDAGESKLTSNPKHCG